MHIKNDQVDSEQMDMERILNQYGDGLLRMCFLYLKDRTMAEDALQETMLRAYRTWSRFEGRASEKTYLTTIAANVCRNMLKSAWLRRFAGSERLESLAAPDSPEAEDFTVTRAVLALPDKLREAVVLYYYREMKLREIAQALGISVSSVSARLERAKKRLRTQLKEWYFDE